MKFFFLIVLLFSIQTYSQNITGQSENQEDRNLTIPDSSNSESFKLPKPGFNYTLPQNSLFSDNIKFNLEGIDYFNVTFFPYAQEEMQPRSLAGEFKKYNDNLHSAMKMIPDFQRKKDLGVLGEILGYTNAAATIGLLIYHLHKYKDDY